MQNTQWHTARYIDPFDRIMYSVNYQATKTKSHPRYQHGELFGLLRQLRKSQSEEGYQPKVSAKFLCSAENINWADKIHGDIPFDMPGGDNHDNN